MPTPEYYVQFPGTAREALTFYGEIFGLGRVRRRPAPV